MDESVLEINNSYKNILNIIRCKPGIEKTVLAKELDTTFKTLVKQLDKLEKWKFITTEPMLQINKNRFYICGISIGGSHCKLSISNANYEAISKEEFDILCEKYGIFQQDFFAKTMNITPYGYKYFDTPEERSALEKYLREIVMDIVKLYDLSLNDQAIPTPISVGIACTGSIDSERQVIIRSHNLDYMKNVSREMLLEPDALNALKSRGIEFIIDHNAKAMAVCEKFSLYNKSNINHNYCSKKNIACLYLGSGIGCGVILNNRLIRGCRNFSGELGHIQVPRHPDFRNNPLEESCTCGASECLEHLIIHDVFHMTRNEFRKITSEKIRKSLLELKTTDPDEFDKRMRVLGYYIGWAVDMITKLLNVGLIIFSGKMTCFIEEAWSYIKPINSELNYALTDCPMILSSYAALAPSVGAAILSTYPAHELIEWII